MEFGFTLNRNENDITAGLNIDIARLITKSIETNSIESFHKIDGFCNRILLMSIENRNIVHFNEYLDVVIGYYVISYGYSKKNPALYGKIHSICADYSARRIKELFLILNHIFNKSSVRDKGIINHFKLSAFSAFSKLLYLLVDKRDLHWFKNTLNLLDNVILGETIEMSEFALAFMDPSKKISDDRRTEYIEDTKAKFYVKHTLLGIKYWLYYLFFKQQMDKYELDTYLAPINEFDRSSLSVEFWEMALLFYDLNSGSNLKYLTWGNWDYQTHQEGKAYWMPQPLDWIFAGYIIDCLRNRSITNVFPVDTSLIYKDVTPQDKSLFVGMLKSKLDEIKKNKCQWLEFFNNEKDLSDGIHTIEEQLKAYSSSLEIQTAKTIAAEKLDANRVADFKQNFYSRWNQSKLIRNLFEYFKNKDKYTGGEQLKKIGQNIFFEKAKFIFLGDQYYQPIHGIEDTGARLSRAEDDYFFQTVLSERTEVVYTTVIEGLQHAVDRLKSNEHPASIIFIDNHLYWQGLRNDKKWSDEKVLDYPGGTYDSIPVIFINTRGLMQNRFIAANFKDAFSMLYQEIEGGFDNELKIEIKEVTDEQAQERLDREPLKWKNVDGRTVSDDDALTLIKSSVIIDYEVIELFKINDDHAFEVGLIDNQSSL